MESAVFFFFGLYSNRIEPHITLKSNAQTFNFHQGNEKPLNMEILYTLSRWLSKPRDFFPVRLTRWVPTPSYPVNGHGTIIIYPDHGQAWKWSQDAELQECVFWVDRPELLQKLRKKDLKAIGRYFEKRGYKWREINLHIGTRCFHFAHSDTHSH